MYLNLPAINVSPVLFEANENNVQPDAHICSKRIYLKIGKTDHSSQKDDEDRLNLCLCKNTWEKPESVTCLDFLEYARKQYNQFLDQK